MSIPVEAYISAHAEFMTILIETLQLPYSNINLKQGLCCTDGMNSANEDDKHDP
jgi:hypothetical protein